MRFQTNARSEARGRIVPSRNGHNESAKENRENVLRARCLSTARFLSFAGRETEQKDPKRERWKRAVPEENRTERPETGHKDHRC